MFLDLATINNILAREELLVRHETEIRMIITEDLVVQIATEAET